MPIFPFILIFHTAQARILNQSFGTQSSAQTSVAEFEYDLAMTIALFDNSGMKSCTATAMERNVDFMDKVL